MKRFFNHLIQIVFFGGIFFLMINLPLLKIPYIQDILTGLVFLCLLIFFGILGYKKRKNLLKIIIISVLCMSHVGFASVTGYVDTSASAALMSLGQNVRCSTMNYCTSAEKYDEATFNARQNNWKGDKACANVEFNCVREKLNKLKNTPPVFVAQDKLTLKEKQTYRSFRKDSHWQKFVTDNYSELASGTDSAEELACAAKLASLCSEYDRRHPSSKAKTVTQIMQEDAKNSGCWPCKMAYIILSVVQDLSSNLESKMQEAALRILQMLFLLWILYTAFLAVVFPSKGNSFLKDLMNRLFCVIIAATLLSSGTMLKDLYRTTLSPMLSLGLGLTQEINDVIKVDNSFAKEVRQRGNITSGTDYCVSSTGSSGTGNNPFAKILVPLSYQSSSFYKKNQSSQDTLISPELQAHLLCMTQNMYRQFSPITATGQSLIGFSIADEKKGWVGKIISWLAKFFTGYSVPNLKMWSVGAILVSLFTVFSFLVAFKIIDIFLRLGFVLVLMPLFVATWAFPVTRDFTKKGFMFLMSIITEFLGLALAVNFIMVLFETGIVGNREELIAKMVAPYSKDYGENLLNVVISNGGWCFLFMLIALALMGFKLLSVCTQVIASFFGTKAVGGDIMGATAVSAIQTAGKLGKKGWDLGSKAAENAESHHTPTDKSMSYVAGRAVGRLKSGQNPLKDVPNPFRDVTAKSSSAAPKRYFGQKAGDGVNQVSQGLAKGLDRIGVTAGQALQKTGIGAIVGVPLTLATKTLTTGIRAAGKITSTVIKTPGAVVYGAKKAPQVIKNAPKILWNKATATPKKIWGEFKRGFDKGK